MSDRPGADDADQPLNSSEVWDRLQALPSMKEDPLVWDHRVGGFVRSSVRDAAAPAHPTPPPPPPAASPPPPPSPPAPRPAPSAPDPTMVLPVGDGAERRWGENVVGAGTDRRHVVVNPTDGSARSAGPRGPAGPAAPAAAMGMAGAHGPGAGMPAAPARPPMPLRPPAGRRGRPAAPGPQAPAPARAPRRRRRGRLLRRLVLSLFSVPLLIAVGLFAFGWYKFSQIPRVEVASALSPAAGAGTNYLIVGTDSREGITASDPNSSAFLGGGEAPTGARTDSIMVMRVAGDQQSLLSIPRDLWVKDPKTGQMGRINATYNAGPTNLIQAVQGLGIPVHHYVEINFVSFGKLVDAVGGIDVNFDFPSRDEDSGLYIDNPGVNHLNGEQALAYVRARHFEELKNGRWVEDPTSDIGRIQRQRGFLTALMNRVTDSRNPFELSRVTGAMSVGLKLDDGMNFLDAIRLGWRLKGFHPESVALPVTPRTTSGGAAVLDLKPAEAQPLIQQFGT